MAGRLGSHGAAPCVSVPSGVAGAGEALRPGYVRPPTGLTDSGATRCSFDELLLKGRQLRQGNGEHLPLPLNRPASVFREADPEGQGPGRTSSWRTARIHPVRSVSISGGEVSVP